LSPATNAEQGHRTRPDFAVTLNTLSVFAAAPGDTLRDSPSWRKGSPMVIRLVVSWWNAFARPWTPAFQGAISGKSHVKTFVSVALGAVLGLGLSWLTHQLINPPQQDFMGLASIWVRSGTPPPIGTWAFIIPCGVVCGFYNFEIVLFIAARLLGGKGAFGTQAYLQSLFYAPLSVVQQVLTVIPGVGRLLFAMVAVYSLLLTTTSLKAAHGYSTLRAILTWVIPIVLNIIVVTAIILLISRTAR
jgi:hypothetical protein